MLKVALTGNIASGKSTVAQVWKDLGATIIESDELARRAVAPGTRGLERVLGRWGTRVLQPDGSLDRSALRDIVFRDSGERRELEAIIHPEIHRLRDEELARLEPPASGIVTADVPLLFEAGLEKQFDLVVLVDAPESTRRERLTQIRKISLAEAQRMIASQWPAERKRPHADFVIENFGTIEDLQRDATKIWRELETLAASKGMHA